MLLGRIKELLYKYKSWMTYVGVLIAFNLMLILAYDEIVVNHENPVKLIVSIVVLGVAIFASYIGRRRHMLSYCIPESSDDINIYALDLNYRFM